MEYGIYRTLEGLAGVRGGPKGATWARHTRDRTSGGFSMPGSGGLLVGTAQKVEKTGSAKVSSAIFAMAWHSETLEAEDREYRINLKRRTRLLSTHGHSHFSCVTLPTPRRRQLRRFANLITARPHRNSLAHVVYRTSQGLDERRRHAALCTGSWNPATTRNFTTRSSPCPRGFIPEARFRFCGSPGVPDTRPVAT
jgi:hypothetical protein